MIRARTAAGHGFWLGIGVPLLLFVWLAWPVAHGQALPFDLPLLHWFRAQQAPGFDVLALLFSAVGYAWGVIPADILLCLVLLWRRQWRWAAFAAVTLAGSGLLNMLMKHLIARPRPALWESLAPELTWSFPSGHAMGAMTLVAVLWVLWWPGRWRWPSLLAGSAFVLMVAASRVYLGVHYPSDVLAGICLALVWVQLMRAGLLPHGVADRSG